jgi:hypothetical protein
VPYTLAFAGAMQKPGSHQRRLLVLVRCATLVYDDRDARVVLEAEATMVKRALDVASRFGL